MPFTATTAIYTALALAGGAVAYEETRKAKSKAGAATKAAEDAMKLPVPLMADVPASSAAAPTVVELGPGEAADKARRRRARAGSRSLFSRGLLYDEPSIYQTKLGGSPTSLGG